MQCPYCQHTESRVLESRSTEGGQSVRRRRECLCCRHRFTTYERIEFIPISVHKRDGSREPFERSKILRGIVKACEKTGTSHTRIEALVDKIESKIRQLSSREITSNEIGELVLEYLRQENEVAYVRFASVYHQFQGTKDFVDTLKELQQNSNHHEITQQQNNLPSTTSEISIKEESNSVVTHH